jgi:hypothetical protein
MIAEGAVAIKLSLNTIDFWESCLIVLAIFGSAIIFRTGFTVIDIIRDIMTKSEENTKKIKV